MIIKEDVQNEYIINKSRFITYLYKTFTKEEFTNYYNELKEKYKDATHICYAYIINNEIKFSDDKEPSGSAGLPIYDVLKKNNLNYISCFVIRYFGGIKLGGSGLIRAYSNSVSLCLKKTIITNYQERQKIEINIPYSKTSVIESLIDKEYILEKKFLDNITYIILATNDELEKLNNLKIAYKIIKDD